MHYRKLQHEEGNSFSCRSSSVPEINRENNLLLEKLQSIVKTSSPQVKSDSLSKEKRSLNIEQRRKKAENILHENGT